MIRAATEKDKLMGVWITMECLGLFGEFWKVS